MKKLGLLVTIGFLATLISCGKDYRKFEGTFERIKKIDAADNSSTKFDSNKKINKGLIISVKNSSLIAKTVTIDKDQVLAANTKILNLVKTDDEIFQYKNPNNQTVLTFYWSDDGLQISEFQKSNSGQFKKESDTYFKKIK